jgi:uroporphyrinogen decarboxylase
MGVRSVPSVVKELPVRFLEACARRPVDATPVWLMRQAGRYMREYRVIKEKLSFIEMCRRPEVAAEVTLQPIDAFDLDAAIVFADILLPLEGMGIGFHFTEGEGPVIERPVRQASDLEHVRPAEPQEHLPYVLEAIRLVRRELDGRLPLIGFAGAPFTLASYIVEGAHSRSYSLVKGLMYSDQRTWDRLMEIVAETVSLYLLAQLEAGAQCLQLFDSWVGALSPYDYEKYAAPYTRAVLARVSGRGAPVVHFVNGASGMLPLVRAQGGDVIGVDWRIDLDRAWDEVGHDVAIQGNLDPVALLGPPAGIEERVSDILRRAGGCDGHIFNLGHGILPQTPVDNVRYLVDSVHRLSARETV